MGRDWEKAFEEREKHPSYGTAGFNRRFGGGRSDKMFGSSVRTHPSTVALTIYEASRYHDLHADRIWGEKEIIEIEFTAAQFAELLTTMNVGTGVPCTIRQRMGHEKIPPPPGDEVEIDRVHQSFHDDIADLRGRVKKQSEDLAELLTKKSLSKADRKQVQWIVDKVRQDIESNWGFVVDQFNEATERVVVAAKSEVDSFVTAMVNKTGLEQLRGISSALAGGSEVIEHRALTSGGDEEQDNGSTQGKEGDSE